MIKLYCDRCGREITDKEVSAEVNGKKSRIPRQKAINANTHIDRVICVECARRECSESVRKAIAEA